MTAYPGTWPTSFNIGSLKLGIYATYTPSGGGAAETPIYPPIIEF
jgi:hypothetical protein